MSKSVVDRVTIEAYDQDIIREDFEKKILPNMPRKVPLLNATLPTDPDDHHMLYTHRPELEEYVKGTIFEDILMNLPFKRGRATFIHQLPGMTLRFHRDPDDKYHIAINDPPGAFFFDMEYQTGYRVPCDGHLYKLNTAARYHTAVNADCKDRTHLVICPYFFEDDFDKPTTIATFGFDHGTANMPDVFTSIATPNNSIEQGFFVEWISTVFHDTTCKNIWGENTSTGRRYHVEFTDKDRLEKHMTSALNLEASHAAEQFGIVIENTYTR